MGTAQIDIEIDKLTNSIQNRITGEAFDTEVYKIEQSSSHQIKKKDWVFDWKKELTIPNREIYKLVTVQNPSIIQGLICFEDIGDSLFMHLIEASHFNKGKDKVYAGVAGNLVAFACKRSFEKGYDGYVSFYAKTVLKEHYSKTLMAKILFNNHMYIDTEAALNLVMQYYKDTRI